MEQIVYLEVDDDILTVRDRLRRAQSKQVLLVVPAGCKAIKRQLDLRLLSRQVAALQMDVALVSGDATLRDLALEEGLVVFPRLSLGRRVSRPQSQKRASLPGLEGLRKRLERHKPRWWNWVLGPLAIAAVLGVLAWSLVMILPSATVTLVPAREPIGVSVVVEANPMTRGADWERLRLPARYVQVEVVERGEVETTGYTNVAVGRSVGNVLFVNRTQRQVFIPMGTRVSTSAGTPVIFQTTVPATVGPRGQARVPIEAIEAGPSGNVAATLINRVEGALTASVSILNETATYGGTNTQARRVTHGDKQRASDLLTEMLIQKAYTEITAELEGEFVPIETLQINPYSVQTNYGRHVDDQADKLELEMRGAVWGVAISEESAIEAARQALNRQVRGGFHLLPETAHFTRGSVIEIDDQTLTVRFLMEGVALMEADIDAHLLRQAISGRPVEQALAYLRQTLPVEKEPSLTMDPSWMPRVPWMFFRIGIVYEGPTEDVARALPGS